ncbi:hypothetical protein BLA29_012371, partial [Euroglyphus maynei]
MPEPIHLLTKKCWAKDFFNRIQPSGVFRELVLILYDARKYRKQYVINDGIMIEMINNKMNLNENNGRIKEYPYLLKNRNNRIGSGSSNTSMINNNGYSKRSLLPMGNGYQQRPPSLYDDDDIDVDDDDDDDDDIDD